MVPVFDKNLHSYVDAVDGTKLQSVTQWVNQYKKPFDQLGMAARIAKRDKITVEQVLADWDKKRTDSTTYGTGVHKMLETYFHDGLITPDNEQIVESFKLLNINFNPKHTHFEKIVFDKSLKIAGTADVIEHVGAHMFNVYDFKTNKNFRISSKYDDQMLEPLQHLPGTEYFVYALQLSMYAMLYEHMTGRVPNRLRVLWLSRTEKENYNHHYGIWKIYSMPYLREDIERCLDGKHGF